MAFDFGSLLSPSQAKREKFENHCRLSHFVFNAKFQQSFVSWKKYRFDECRFFRWKKGN